MMTTSVQLDYQTVLANQAQPVHLAFQFTAPATGQIRERPIAFSLVLDRSGSMQGEPLAAARRAAKAVVQNLRREDWFSLVTFDDQAEVVIPIGPILTRAHALGRIETIASGGSTNLTAGWMLGRDALRETPAGMVRRQLLLTDGLLNVGIVESPRVKQVVTDGLERDGIRTSALGFGDGYDEELLASLAQATNGAFYDANNPDKLPAIFAAELDGLQKTAIQNLRLRFRSLGFVEACESLGGYAAVELPDGRREFAVGDLMSEEDRVAVFALAVLPIPLVPGTRTPAATLEGEAIAEVEILYDEITPTGITSRSERHVIRVRSAQDPQDVQVNENAIAWVSAQQAAGILTQALSLRDEGKLAAARQLLEGGITRLKAYGCDRKLKDAISLLETALRELAETKNYSRSRKTLRSMSASFMKMSSADLWTSEIQAMPSFKKPPQPNQPLPESKGGAQDGNGI